MLTLHFLLRYLAINYKFMEQNLVCLTARPRWVINRLVLNRFNGDKSNPYFTSNTFAWYQFRQAHEQIPGVYCCFWMFSSSSNKCLEPCLAPGLIKFILEFWRFSRICCRLYIDKGEKIIKLRNAWLKEQASQIVEWLCMVTDTFSQYTSPSNNRRVNVIPISKMVNRQSAANSGNFNLNCLLWVWNYNTQWW